jgi:hypothetical protein
VWIQVEALIVIAMNDSTIELASVPAFTAQKGTRGQLLADSSWSWAGK